MRQVGLCWCLSIGFELAEISLQHWLPNFSECWWDHLLLDLFGCNLIGIYLGMRTCKYFSMKQYHWTGVASQPSKRAKLKRMLMQVTPVNWEESDWQALSSPRMFGALLFMCFAFLLSEVNAFFLKHVLYVPPRNPLNTYRCWTRELGRSELTLIRVRRTGCFYGFSLV